MPDSRMAMPENHNDTQPVSGPTERRLTPTMRRHLRELAEIGPEAAWGPESSGEWRCAEALERRGLLQRNVSRGSRPFALTSEGYAIGQRS
jgi:hypothetical protein